MQGYGTKIIDLAESNAKVIAKQWAADVRKHKRTPSYHNLPEDQVIDQAIIFYMHFRQMFFTEKPFEAAKGFSIKYAEDRYKEKIPLQEALYALILIRRHLWLYAEFQAIFITTLEQRQATESLNRTILMFDYVCYQVTERYQELLSVDVDKRLGIIKSFTLEHPGWEQKSFFKTGMMFLMLIFAGALTYYYHAVVGTGAIFTHLFYIPIILAALWWKRAGVYVSLALGMLLLLSHAAFLDDVPFTENVVRAFMFLIIGTVLDRLMDGIRQVEGLYKQLTM
ncbi:MAG: hypothetical protein JXA41_11410 [Deltaproteobacteria bacterium]|nr:hypothetical protein [Deltaproteobacteria bacterium]